MIKLRKNFIRSYDDSYAIEVTESTDHLLVEDCIIDNSQPSFWKEPLLWVAYKVIDRKFRKLVGGDLRK